MEGLAASEPDTGRPPPWPVSETPGGSSLWGSSSPRFLAFFITASSIDRTTTTTMTRIWRSTGRLRSAGGLGVRLD